MPFMRILHKWHFYLVISKKCCIFAPAIPRRGCLHVIGWGSRHIKRRLLALCSDSMKSRKFLPDKNLATIDVLRDIDYPSCAYFGTSFAYMRMRTRVP